MSDAAVTDVAASYLSLLQGFTAGGSSKADSGSHDNALAAAEAGTSTAGAPLAASASKLRYAAQWEWNDVLFAPAPGAPPRKAGLSDAAYEMASVLSATALRLMHAAALACTDSASGVATPASTRAYNLLRQAAGMLEFVEQKLLPSLPVGASADLNLPVGAAWAGPPGTRCCSAALPQGQLCPPPGCALHPPATLQAVRGLAALALGGAQHLTLLRAVAKGNQPSLIATIATDTSALYGQAGGQVWGRTGAAPGARAPQPGRTCCWVACGGSGGSPHHPSTSPCTQLGPSAVPGAGPSKLGAYCLYKQHYCAAYAHAFTAIGLWKSDQAGQAIKGLEAAAAAQAAARAAAGGYDAAPPATLNLHHRRADEDLQRIIEDSSRRIKRENDSVFLQVGGKFCFNGSDRGALKANETLEARLRPSPPPLVPQPVAREVPPLPEGKRLVSSTPYSLPPPAPAVNEGVVDRCFGAGPPAPTAAPGVVTMAGGAAAGGAAAAAAAGEGGEPCNCCRWATG